MRSTILHLIILAALFLFSGFYCPYKCEEEICNDSLAVRFLSKTDGADLFLNGTYQTDSLRVFTYGSDTILSDITPFMVIQRYDDFSYFNFEVRKHYSGYVFQFNSAERDTLLADYLVSSTSCCKELTNFNFGVFRGDTVLRSGNWVVDLVK